MTKQNKAVTLLSGITGISLETHAVVLVLTSKNAADKSEA